LAEPAVGEEGESGEGGGASVSEGRALCEAGESSLDDAQPARTMQAVAIATASFGNGNMFMRDFILDRSGGLWNLNIRRKVRRRYSNVTFFFE